MITLFRLRRAELHAGTAASELVSVQHSLGLMREIFSTISTDTDVRLALEQSVVDKLKAARINLDAALKAMGGEL